MTVEQSLINRREAIRRVSFMLGGAAFVGGSGLLVACERPRVPVVGAAGAFSVEDIALLDEIAETILPETKTPGAKAANTGAFMALMVTDTYDASQQKTFRDGMRKVDEASQKAYNVSFMSATPAQRLAVLVPIDREQKRVMDQREAADRRKKGLAPLPTDSTRKGGVLLADDQKQNAPGVELSGAAAVPADEPTPYFRMMKELALLGYFTSEIGYTKAMRYVESPGRFDPCTPYTPGEPAWASHA
jgi:hypothetical protein